MALQFIISPHDSRAILYHEIFAMIKSISPGHRSCARRYRDELRAAITFARAWAGKSKASLPRIFDGAAKLTVRFPRAAGEARLEADDAAMDDWASGACSRAIRRRRSESA